MVPGYRFRRLLYVFGPLFKMALLAPEAHRDQAVRLVVDTPFRNASEAAASSVAHRYDSSLTATVLRYVTETGEYCATRPPLPGVTD